MLLAALLDSSRGGTQVRRGFEGRSREAHNSRYQMSRQLKWVSKIYTFKRYYDSLTEWLREQPAARSQQR